MNGISDEKKEKLFRALKWIDEYSADFEDKDEHLAKFRLNQFFRDLCMIKPDEYFDFGYERNYYSFYWTLIPVMLAMREGKYALASHEIITLCYCENSIFQKRVYSGLMFLYRKYLRSDV